jgi:hypothetical protein
MLVWFHKHSKHRVTALGRLDHPNIQFNVDTHKLVAHKWKNCLVDLERQEYLFHASRLSFDWTAEEGMRTSSTGTHALAWLAEEAYNRIHVWARGYLIWWNVVLKF